MITGLGELEEFEQKLRALAEVPKRAAARALPKLLELVHAESSAGESAEGAAWDRLKAGGSTPLKALTDEITGSAEENVVVITTPDELKYHQGGFLVHGGHGAALREAKKSAVTAKSEADVDGLKRARKKIRDIKKAARAPGTPDAKRPTLPISRRALPVAWGRVLDKAWNDEIAATMKGSDEPGR